MTVTLELGGTATTVLWLGPPTRGLARGCGPWLPVGP